MKKIKFLVLIFLGVLLLSGCKKDGDAILFKKEYEGLNSNSNYRSVSIPDENPMVYITDKDLAKKIEAKEDMVVYFGFNRCPWCRSIIGNLLKASSDLKIDKIYYLDILNIRDTKTINDAGDVEIETKGSDGYNEIVKLLGDNLADYVVSSKIVGKRIYAPNILVIKNGEIKPVITGISDLQNDSKMELTDEINEDSYNKIYKLLSQYAEAPSCDGKEGC